MMSREFSNHLADLHAIERRQRNRAMVRPHAPRRADSGRAVTMINNGACAPRSANARMRSSEVGSAQCRSSKASTTGCVRAPPESRPSSPPAAAGATPLARVSPPDPLAGGHRLKARAGAHIRLCPNRPELRVFSRSARRSAVGRSAPKRWRPILRSDAAGYSATAATTTTRPRCAASHRGGRETPPSAWTCPGQARRQSAPVGRHPDGRDPSAAQKIELLVAPDEGLARARRCAGRPLARTTR